MPPNGMTLHPAQGGGHFYGPGIIAAFPIMQAPPPLPKRSLEPSDDDAAPKAKKSRAKAKSTSEGPGTQLKFLRLVLRVLTSS